MAYLGNQPSNNFVSLKRQVITGDGTTSYTLDHSVASVNDVAIFVNNVRQDPASYSISGTALTLGGTISSSDSCYVIFLGQALQTVTPATGTVTNAMLGETITVAKGGTGVTTSADLANTGNLVHIKTITLSSSSSAITFLNSDADVTFDTTYNTYKFIGNVLHATDNTSFYVRVSHDGTNLNSSSSQYKYNVFSTADDAYNSPNNDGLSSVWQISQNPEGNATGEHVNFEMTIFNDTNLGTPRHFTNLMGVRTDNGSEPTIASGRYIASGTNTIKGITFFPSSSRSWSANSVIRMYGVKG